MFIFLAAFVVTTVVVAVAATAVTSAIVGPITDSPDPIDTYDTPIISNVHTKANLTPSGETIIGLRDPTLVKNPSTLTTTTFDTTTYADRAVIKLTNSTGASVALTGLSIRGKIVSQLAGQNGYVWEYSDYDSMEKEGERFVEVSNDFIFGPIQAKQIGDFVWKELKPHKIYGLMLVGCHYQYEIGDVYHLTLSHTLAGGTMENIDTDVEIIGSSISRNAGGVGKTALSLRVPSAAWALTLAKNSKLVGAGKAQWLNNRSNVVTVASSTWTGQADYFCDGISDDVEIQAALDILSSRTDGRLILTGGSFYISETLNIPSNIVISGNSDSTKLYFSSNKNILIYLQENISIESMYLDFINVAKGIDINSSNYVTIVDLSMSRVSIPLSKGMIDGYSSNNVTISRCRINCNNSPGGAIILIANNNSIESNYIYNVVSPSYGLHVSGNNSNISGNIISYCYNGIFSYTAVQTQITGNSLYGISNHGIYMLSSINSVISGNSVLCLPSATYGIRLSSTTSMNNVITGNRVTGAITNFSDSGLATINSGNSFA